MVTMFSKHRVSDYEAWRKAADDYRDARKKAGVTSEAIYQSADDPNEITWMLDFETIEAARAFPNNQELRS